MLARHDSRMENDVVNAGLLTTRDERMGRGRASAANAMPHLPILHRVSVPSYEIRWPLVMQNI